MRKLVQVILLLCAIGFFSSLTTWGASDPEKDCPPDLVCFAIPEAQGLAHNLIRAKQRQLTLEARVVTLEAKRPARFGWTVGVGMGVGYDLLNQRVDVEPFVGIVYGVRF
jgi:hypothetical protein